MKRKRRAVAVREKAAPKALQSVDDGGGWMNVWSGGGYSPWQMTQGFQLDIDCTPQRLQSNWVVFACQTLIAGDLGKLRIALVELTDGVWQETTSTPYNRLLIKPNGYQTWQQFIEYWSASKQRRGNTYVLLERDNATRVRAMYVLNPDRVTPLVAPDGSVFYRLQTDDLATVPDGEVIVPASEIIHDRFNCLFHPLVGLSPLYAATLAATSGLTMQEQAAVFFNNGSRPGGILTTPGPLMPEQAKLYKAEWETNFGGGNRGRTAVLGNGLKYDAIRENAVDSELVALLKMSAEMICSVHHVPAYKVGVGTTPIQSAADVLNQIYYDNCLQQLIKAIESLLDEALELDNVGARSLRSRFDMTDLIRMDGIKQIEYAAKAVERGIFSINEGRRLFNQPPVKGGEEPLSQQQYFPISMLREFHMQEMANAKTAAEAPPPAPANEDNADAAAQKLAVAIVQRAMAHE